MRHNSALMKKSRHVSRASAQPRAQSGAKTRGNQTKAALMLGLSRFGLQKMMKRLGVKGVE